MFAHLMPRLSARILTPRHGADPVRGARIPGAARWDAQRASWPIASAGGVCPDATDACRCRCSIRARICRRPGSRPVAVRLDQPDPAGRTTARFAGIRIANVPATGAATACTSPSRCTPRFHSIRERIHCGRMATTSPGRTTASQVRVRGVHPVEAGTVHALGRRRQRDRGDEDERRHGPGCATASARRRRARRSRAGRPRRRR